MKHDASLAFKRLKEQQPPLQDLLLASPYDPFHDIYGYLNKELFVDRLFFLDDSFESLNDELGRTFASVIYSKKVVLITGYNGVGKSTFLWYFMDQHPDFEHYYVDFHNCGPDDATDKPLTKVIRDQVVGMDGNDQINCLRLIKNNAPKLGLVFSREFLAFMREVDEGKIEKDFIFDNFHHIGAVDMLLLYLMMIFLVPRTENPIIVYFDNLDAAGVDYLADEFRNNFRAALGKAVLLSRFREWYPARIDFTKQVRFVLCLRDATSAVFNAHTEDSLGPAMKCIAFRVNMTSDFYRGVLKKRLDFVRDVRGEHPESAAISNALLEFIGDRSFVEPALVDLFNGDYRKLAYALLEIAEQRGSKIPDRKWKYYKFGTRAVLMRGVIQFLTSHGYLGDHTETAFDSDKPGQGVFHQLRMVLNVILNCSGRTIDVQTSDPSGLVRDCSLYELAFHLKGIYPYREVLRTAAKCFLYHKENWVQLLSIYKKPVQDLDAFHREEGFLVELDAIDKESDFILTDEEQLRSKEIKQELGRIGLKITPAGYSYLKYLNTHFEFYSAFACPDGPALFEIDPQSLLCDSEPDESQEFEFERIIDRVFKRFEGHFQMLRKFYFNEFKGKLEYTSTGFRRSVFSYRYHGDDSPKVMGMFHSSRVMHSHIDYIDTFRRHVLSAIPPESAEVLLINKKLIDRIDRYIKLLRGSHDHSEWDRCDAFSRNIAKIRESNYTDTTTRIKARAN